MPKKKHMVVARNERTSEHGLMTSKGHVPFNMKTAKIIDDDGLASEIDTQYGLKGTGDVWVERDERLENQVNYHPDNTHKYFFGSNRRFADGWERIFGKKVKDAREIEVPVQENAPVVSSREDNEEAT